MGLATGVIIGSLVFGTGMGFRGCTKEPIYKVGECVRSVDSFGDYDSDYIRKITNINKKDYKFKVWSKRFGFFFENTLSIELMDDPNYNKQVECPE